MMAKSDAEPFSRRADLERAREVCWMALDGDRMLQRAAKNGEQSTFTESAAPLLAQLRQIVAELDKLTVPEGVPVDEVERRRKAKADAGTATFDASAV